MYDFKLMIYDLDNQNQLLKKVGLNVGDNAIIGSGKSSNVVINGSRDRSILIDIRKPKKVARGTILFLHGNAGNLFNRVHKLNVLHELDINILIISWRSFSGNLGKPTENGFYKDHFSLK